jgi:signal transduction histidine kinase
VDFELAPEQREIQGLARDFAAEKIEPYAAEWDRDHRFPRELFAELAELGLMGACVPDEYGGAGADFVSYILVLEELSRADAGRIPVNRAPANVTELVEEVTQQLGVLAEEKNQTIALSARYRCRTSWQCAQTSRDSGPMPVPQWLQNPGVQQVRGVPAPGSNAPRRKRRVVRALHSDTASAARPSAQPASCAGNSA